MGNKIIIYFLTLFLFSCSKYYHFDELYNQDRYLEAFSVLEKIENKNDISYIQRYLVILIRLAIEGDEDFIRKLKELEINNQKVLKKLTNYILLKNNLIDYINANNINDYYKIISNLQDFKLIPNEFLDIAYKIRGISYYKTGYYDKAIKDLNESQKIEASIDNIYFIGLSYQSLEDYKNAKKFYELIFQNSTNNKYVSLAFYQLGELEYFNENFTNALNYYIIAINKFSKYANYTDQIGRCFMKLKYPKLSQKFFKTSLRIQKDDANAWFYLNLN